MVITATGTSLAQCGTSSGSRLKANITPTCWTTSKNITRHSRHFGTRKDCSAAWTTNGIGAQSCKAVPHDSHCSVVGVEYPCPDRLACNSWLDDQGRTHGDGTQ